MPPETEIARAAAALMPTVHLNGDSYVCLEEEWETFHEAIREIRFPECNARNYYVRGEKAIDACQQAKAQIQHQLARIAEIALQVRLLLQEQRR